MVTDVPFSLYPTTIFFWPHKRHISTRSLAILHSHSLTQKLLPITGQPQILAPSYRAQFLSTSIFLAHRINYMPTQKGLHTIWYHTRYYPAATATMIRNSAQALTARYFQRPKKTYYCKVQDQQMDTQR
jgi:hypothetical protein